MNITQMSFIFSRKLFLDDISKNHYRVAWLRLVACAERLLHWARDSAMPPSTLVVALQSAQLDPALEMLYPDLRMRISASLQVNYRSMLFYKIKLIVCNIPFNVVRYLNNYCNYVFLLKYRVSEKFFKLYASFTSSEINGLNGQCALFACEINNLLHHSCSRLHYKELM